MQVPDITFGMQAHESNSSGQQDTAKTCRCLALGCNITVVVIYALEVIMAIALITVAVTGGFSVYNSYQSSYGGCTTRYTCGYYGFGGGYTCTYRCTY